MVRFAALSRTLQRGLFASYHVDTLDSHIVGGAKCVGECTQFGGINSALGQ